MVNMLFQILEYSQTQNQCIELELGFRDSQKTVRIKKSNFFIWLDREGRCMEETGTISHAAYFKGDHNTILLDLHDYIVGAKYNLVAKELADQMEEGISDFQD